MIGTVDLLLTLKISAGDASLLVDLLQRGLDTVGNTNNRYHVIGPKLIQMLQGMDA